jgi:hypothetical protein
MGRCNYTFLTALMIPTTFGSFQCISRSPSKVKDSHVKLKDLKVDMMDDPHLQSE